MDCNEFTIVEGDVQMDEREKIINVFSALGLSRKFAKTLMYLSETETNKKKMKKWYMLDDEVDDEVEEEYYNDYYEIIRYPPNSNPPSVNNKISLKPHTMIS